MKFKAMNILTIALLFTSCSLMKSDKQAQKVHSLKITNAEMMQGISEALKYSIKKNFKIADSGEGTGFGIVLPPAAQKVKEKASELGLSDVISKLENGLNKVASNATAEVLPIFDKYVNSISFKNGEKMLKAGNGGITNYLKQKTEKKLVAALSNKVDKHTSKVKLDDTWKKYHQKIQCLDDYNSRRKNRDGST